MVSVEDTGSKILSLAPHRPNVKTVPLRAGFQEVRDGPFHCESVAHHPTYPMESRDP